MNTTSVHTHPGDHRGVEQRASSGVEALRKWSLRRPLLTETTTVAAVLGGIVVAVAWPLLTGKTFSVIAYSQRYTYPWATVAVPDTAASAQSDQMESSGPWADFTHRVWRGFDWPLWDPHGYAGGAPFASDGMGNLYPIRVIIDFLLAGDRAHDAFVMTHVVVAALGCYLLCRRLEVGVLGSLLASIAWSTNANAWAVLQLEMITPVIAWLPLTIAAVDYAIRSRGFLPLGVGAVCVAIAVISCNVTYAAVIALAAAVYIFGVVVGPVARRRSASWSELRTRFVRTAVTLGGAVLLSSFVLVPTGRNLGAAARARTTWESDKFESVGWAQLFRRMIAAEPKPGPLTVFGQVYLPVAIVVLALVGMFVARGRAAAAGRTFVIVVALLVTAGPVASVAYHHVPGLMSIFPVRLLPVGVLGMCLLAGAGSDCLMSGCARTFRHLTPTRRPPGLAAAAGGLAAVALVVAVGWQGVVAQRTVSSVPLDPSRYPSFPETPAVTAVRQQTGSTGWPVRVLPTQSSHRDTKIPPSLTSLIGDTPLVFGIDSWGGYDSSAPPRTATLLAIASKNASVIAQTQPIYPTGSIDWPLISRLGADVVFAPPSPGPKLPEDWGSLDTSRLQRVYAGPDGRVYRLRNSSASPYLSGAVSLVAGDAAAIDALRTQGVAGLKIPIIEKNDLRYLHLDELGGQGTVTSARKGVDFAEVRTHTTGRQLVVIPISATPGWHARVNGKPVPIGRADFNYLAVVVPSGNSVVTVKYDPPGWRLGWALTATGLVGLLAGLAVCVRPRRHRATHRR